MQSQTYSPPGTLKVPQRWGYPALFTTGLALAILLIFLSLAMGSNLLSLPRIMAGIEGRDAEARAVVLGLRLPRTILAIMVGIGLAMAGTIMQTLTKNPLGDPGILGVNAGASAAVVTSISFLGFSQPDQYIWVALLGAGLVSVVVYTIGHSRSSGATPVRMALAGTAVGAVLTSYVTAQMLVNPTKFYSFRHWEIGALVGRDTQTLIAVLPFMIVGALLCLGSATSLNAIALGEETSRALGASLKRTRILGVLSVMLLCGASTAAAGPISFVGLAVPHLARMVVGVDHRKLLPLSALFGVLLMLSADIVGRFIVWPDEVAVGVVTALIGAPFLIYLVRVKGVGRL